MICVHVWGTCVDGLIKIKWNIFNTFYCDKSELSNLLHILLIKFDKQILILIFELNWYHHETNISRFW